MASFVVDSDGILRGVSLAEGERVCSIPDFVEGIPVQGIGPRVFTSKVRCESVILNSTCRLIQAFAFFDCATLRRLTIGEGLATIEPHAFAYRNELEQVLISGNNDRYSIINQCLYTKDGSKLVIGVNSEEMKVWDGCIEIGDYAFSYCVNSRCSIFLGAHLFVSQQSFQFHQEKDCDLQFRHHGYSLFRSLNSQPA